MSIIKKLREEKRSNEEFETMLQHLTLEEVFFLRIELENRSFKNNLFGYKIYIIVRDVISEGLVRFALGLKGSKAGAARLLGMDIDTLERNMFKFKIPVKTKKKTLSLDEK